MSSVSRRRRPKQKQYRKKRLPTRIDTDTVCDNFLFKFRQNFQCTLLPRLLHTGPGNSSLANQSFCRPFFSFCFLSFWIIVQTNFRDLYKCYYGNSVRLCTLCSTIYADLGSSLYVYNLLNKTIKVSDAMPLFTRFSPPILIIVSDIKLLIFCHRFDHVTQCPDCSARSWKT